MKYSKVPLTKVLVSFLAVVFAVSVCCFGAAAAINSATGDATISYYPGTVTPPPGGGGGGNPGGTTTPDTDRPTTVINDEPVPEVEIVPIEDGNIPLKDLPKTGGNTLISVLLLAAGALVVCMAGIGNSKAISRGA